MTLSVLCLIGCDASAPVGPPSHVNDGGETLPVRTATLEQFEFDDQGLEQKLRCFTSAAERIAGADWYRRPWKTFRSPKAYGVFLAEWATFANERNRNPINYHGPDEMHCIALSAFFDGSATQLRDNHSRRQPGRPDDTMLGLTVPVPGSAVPTQPTIVGIGMSARWKPAGAGWGATIRYRTRHGRQSPKFGKPDEDFRFSFLRYPSPGSDAEINIADTRIDFARSGDAWYTVDRVFGGEDDKQPPTMYEFVVNTIDSEAREQARGEIPDFDVRRMMGTPEAMRDYGLAMYETLAERIDAEIPTRKALNRVQFARPLEQGEPLERLRSDRPLTADELAAVHRDARESVELKIRLLRENYREMHAALIRAFPLPECLPAKAAPTVEPGQ